MTEADAYELAAKWHDKQAKHCLEIAADEPRIAPANRASARQAANHHAASAAGLRHLAVELRRKALT